MQTIDEISIGRDGDMFTLTIYHYNGELSKHALQSTRTTFVIGLPDQLHAEVQRTIGKWLAEGIELGRRWDEQSAQIKAEMEKPNWPYDPDLARDMERGK